MTSMPTIDDRLVIDLRRAGRRGAKYARKRNANVSGDNSRVVPQVASCENRLDCWGPCDVFPDGTQLFCMGKECTATAAQCGR
jgi:hypothetical protein